MDGKIKIAMFDTKPFDKESFDKYNGKSVAIKYFDAKLDESTARLTKGFDCVVVFVNDEVTEKVIETLVRYGVRLLALRCVGFNNVDLKSAEGRINVVRVPAYSPQAVAEHTIAMLMTSVRRIHKAYNRTREYNFSLEGLKGFELCGKTMGIIGAGKIGRVVIDICNGLGMKVLYHDKFVNGIVNAESVSLKKLFKESDVISLHCPLSEDNYHMINAKTIDTMKTGVIILNTSRGALIDAEDLLSGIKSKKIGGACLDVYEEETDIFFNDRSGHILKDDILARLLTMPNVILTSHQAFLTEEALENIAETTISNVLNFFNGEKIKNENFII